jgi:sensor domain CHASE-containing protein
MQLIIFLISLLLFGLFVFWRMSIVKDLVSPKNTQNVNQQLQEVETRVNNYNQKLEDIQKKTDDAVKGIE